MYIDISTSYVQYVPVANCAAAAKVQPNYTLQLQLTYKPTDLGHLSPETRGSLPWHRYDLEPFWGQHFFEFPIVAAGGGKSEGLRKADNGASLCLPILIQNVLKIFDVRHDQSGVCQHVSVILSQNWEVCFWFIYSWSMIAYIYISYMRLYDTKNDRSQYAVAVCQCPTVQVVHAEALRPRMLFSSLPIGTPLNSQSYET